MLRVMRVRRVFIDGTILRSVEDVSVGRRKRLPHVCRARWGRRFRLPTINSFSVFITFGGPKVAHAGAVR